MAGEVMKGKDEVEAKRLLCLMEKATRIVWMSVYSANASN
jgi:hypothetical protein